MNTRVIKSLAITFLLIIFSACGEQNPVEPGIEPQPPVLEMPEHEFTFGYVPKTASVAHSFLVKNAGGDTLRILKVAPG